MDTNYMKLGQIFQILTDNDDDNTYEKICEIKTIINSGFDVNYKLPSNSLVCQKDPEYSGNTVLHFIAECNWHSNLDLINLIIESGADYTVQNDSTYSPLLLAFDKFSNCENNQLLLLHIKKNNFTNINSEYGISHFHVACTTNHVEIVDSYLKNGTTVNDCVNEDSPKYPGFTPLHFAVKHCRVKTIELLLSVGANWNSKDAKGVTPLHLLLENIMQIKSESYIDMKNILIKALCIDNSLDLPDSIGLTNLHISCVSGKYKLIDRYYKQDMDIDTCIKFDSPVWPGYTALHFASLVDPGMIVLLLEKGANILAKNSDGETFFDLSFEKFELEELILILLAEKRNQLSQTEFTDGTDLLYVLRAMADNTFELFIKHQSTNINMFVPLDSAIFPGFNLLHLAVLYLSSYDYDKTECWNILSSSVNLTMLSANGMSPLHFAFRLKSRDTVRKILNFCVKNPVNVLDPDNLSHLHIACAMQHCEAIKELLRNGSDPNLPTLHDITLKNITVMKNSKIIRTGTTPFHILFRTLDFHLIPLFLSFKANLYAVDADGVTPFQMILDPYLFKDERHYHLESVLEQILDVETTNKMTANDFKAFLDFSFIENENTLHRRLISLFIDENLHEKLGMTKLHVACAMGDLSMVSDELNSGANVNQHIDFNSDLWPGDTPMHILLRRDLTLKLKNEIANLLLKHGADLTLKNECNLTPVHVSRSSLELDIATLLLKNKFTNVNPVNDDNYSHFHMCCTTNNILVIKEFLNSGVDINVTVDYFSNYDSGYTPLHYAVQFGLEEVVELLLKYNADPYLKNANGNTPFHLIISSTEFTPKRVEAYLRCPKFDFLATNTVGESVLDFFLRKCIQEKWSAATVKDLNCIFNLILSKNICINIEKPYWPKLIAYTTSYLFLGTFQRLIQSVTNLTDIDTEGQNAVHHVLNIPYSDSFFDDDYSNDNYWSNFKEIMNAGCELDHMDNEGKTVLHKAVSREHSNIVVKLLILGADVNIKDDKGKTPYDYTVPEDEDLSDDADYITQLMMNHIQILEYAGLFVDQSYKSFSGKEYLDKCTINSINKEKIQLDFEFKKEGLLISVDYFFSEQFVINYRRMPPSLRLAICNICNFEEIHGYFPTTECLIELQLRKARARIRLFEPAMSVLRYRLGLPDLCLEFIFDYLNNNDLMNLVRAEYGKLIFAAHQ